jgi:hypothetical protein
MNTRTRFMPKADQKCLCYAFEVVWIKSKITHSCFKSTLDLKLEVIDLLF